VQGGGERMKGGGGRGRGMEERRVERGGRER
jgi:hypothetical protein